MFVLQVEHGAARLILELYREESPIGALQNVLSGSEEVGKEEFDISGYMKSDFYISAWFHIFSNKIESEIGYLKSNCQ